MNGFVKSMTLSRDDVMVSGAMAMSDSCGGGEEKGTCERWWKGVKRGGNDGGGEVRR